MSNNARACLYLRSSKDRHDVSIEAQRRALVAFANSRSLVVVGEFADVVLSGKTENRPGFQAMLQELKAPARAWDTILALDTSRIARNQWIAHGLRHECKKRDVDLVFEKTPELDGVAGVILPAVLHAMDEVHSMLSREKGLAGMAENVRRGFRAGGRAPTGYRLQAVDTGAMREGEPVTKSRLIPSAEAPAIARYLKGRAAGMPAQRLARELGLRLGKSSLVGVEWCALTYAGHTVWNVHRPRSNRTSYDGGSKRRPRAEWVMQRDTHEALITEDEAEKILGRLERGAETRMRGADYLLSGILVSPSGRRWHGDQHFYRCGNRSLRADRLERQVLEALARDLAGDAIVKHTAAAARRLAKPDSRSAELLELRRAAADLEKRIARVRELIPEMKKPRPLLEQLDELEARREAAADRAAALEREIAGARVLSLITEEDVRAILRILAENLAALDREELKVRLRSLVRRIDLDPERLTCCLHYAIPAQGRVKVASRRGSDLNPTQPELEIPLRRRLVLTGFRRAA